MKKKDVEIVIYGVYGLMIAGVGLVHAVKEHRKARKMRKELLESFDKLNELVTEPRVRIEDKKRGVFLTKDNIDEMIEKEEDPRKKAEYQYLKAEYLI